MWRLCDVGLRTCSEMFEIGMNYRFHMTPASCDIEPGSGIVLDGNDWSCSQFSSNVSKVDFFAPTGCETCRWYVCVCERCLGISCAAVGKKCRPSWQEAKISAHAMEGTSTWFLSSSWVWASAWSGRSDQIVLLESLPFACLCRGCGRWRWLLFPVRCCHFDFGTWLDACCCGFTRTCSWSCCERSKSGCTSFACSCRSTFPKVACESFCRFCCWLCSSRKSWCVDGPMVYACITPKVAFRVFGHRQCCRGCPGPRRCSAGSLSGRREHGHSQQAHPCGCGRSGKVAAWSCLAARNMWQSTLGDGCWHRSFVWWAELVFHHSWEYMDKHGGGIWKPWCW